MDNAAMGELLTDDEINGRLRRRLGPSMRANGSGSNKTTKFKFSVRA